MMASGSLTYAPYDPDRDGEIHRLFRDYHFKDHQLLFMGVSKERMVAYLEKTLNQPEVCSICMREGDQLLGLISVKSLPWLSRHFGFRMYAVMHLLARGENPLLQARLLRYVMEETPQVDFLDCRVAVDDVISAHALEICGFRYVGAEMYLGQHLTPGGSPGLENGIEIRPFRSDRDQDQILSIAGEIHTHNRFSYDPYVQEQTAKSLYSLMVTNCFDHEHFRSAVAVAGGKIKGFIIAKVNPGFSRAVGLSCGSLDFIGVRPESRHWGLGRLLNRWALHHLAREGIAFTAVRTMAGNYPALTVCHSTGFRVTSSSLHFHKWVTRPRQAPQVLPPFEALSLKSLFPETTLSSQLM